MNYQREEYSTRRVIGAATTVLCTGRSFVANIRLNASSNAIYIFDTGSTTTPPLGSAVAVIPSGTIVLSHDLKYIFSSGVVVAGIAANSDFTVAFANN